YIRHFCPLPEEMIEQILKLTTKEGDVVMDCFSGSGTVLSKANNMKRHFIGFELNEEYIEMFNNYLQNTGHQKQKEYITEKNGQMTQDDFKKTIINLRVLKYARLFYRKLKNEGVNEILRIYVELPDRKLEGNHGIVAANYTILTFPEFGEFKQIETKLNKIKG